MSWWQKAALLVFGVLNAMLFACVLPLWEGFDEAFHFGYVQHLARKGKLGVLGETPVSEEVWRSIELAPGSRVVRQYLPVVMSYEEFHALEAEERARRVAALRKLPPELASRDWPNSNNYEAQQAPLAYVLLAPVERWLSARPLVERVLWLRLLVGIGAVALQYWFTLGLARAMGVGEKMQQVALYLVLATPMFYAATAHVANDWLAAPLATLATWRLVAFEESPDGRNGAWLGLALAAGLLTKAYFVAWLASGVIAGMWLAWRGRLGRRAVGALAATLVVAAPWYARNYVLYGSWLGLQQTAQGVTIRDVIAAAREAPWLADALALARGAVWTGNSTFNSFSRQTVDVVLVVVAASLVLALASRGKGRLAVWVSMAVFLGSIAYHNAQTRAHTGLFSAMPWYFQTLTAPVWVLAAAGWQRWGWLGRVLMGVAVGVMSYLLVATYWVKYFLMYSHYGDGVVRLRGLVEWYAANWGSLSGRLGEVTLGDGRVCVGLAAAITVMTLGLAVSCVRGGGRGSPPMAGRRGAGGARRR
jgi:hypothetical protein